MALKQIFSTAQPIINGEGKPVAGAFIHLTQPGNDTDVIGYKDSGLVNAHTVPIKSSGTGRITVWVGVNCDVRVTTDQEGNNVISEELSVNPDALGSEEAGGLLLNGSFETDTDSDGVPDNWVATNETGSTNGLDDTKSTDGAQSYRFTSAGSGGGTLTSENFFPVNDVDNLRVNFDLESSVATVRNLVRVHWYDITQLLISSSDIYDSTANPTSWTSFELVATPPALARFAKVEFVGIDPSVALAGSTWFDRASAFYPQVISGTFDNLTLTGNQIQADNTNGNVDLVGNGTGNARARNPVTAGGATERILTESDATSAITQGASQSIGTTFTTVTNLVFTFADGQQYQAFRAYLPIEMGSGNPGFMFARLLRLTGTADPVMQAAMILHQISSGSRDFSDGANWTALGTSPGLQFINDASGVDYVLEIVGTMEWSDPSNATHALQVRADNIGSTMTVGPLANLLTLPAVAS